MTNVTAPGTGFVFATETIGGVEYQLIKVVTGTAGSTAPADLATQTTLAALLAAAVDTTPIAITNASDGRRTVVATVTRANDTVGYTAGDAVGALFSIPGASRLGNQSIVVCGVKITTNNKLYIPTFRAHFFNAANPASDVADNAPFPVLTADETAPTPVYQGCVDLPPMTTEDTTSTMAYAFDAFELNVVTDANGALTCQLQTKTLISASLALQVFTVTIVTREK